jgi:hypothetical protein
VDESSGGTDASGGTESSGGAALSGGTASGGTRSSSGGARQTSGGKRSTENGGDTSAGNGGALEAGNAGEAGSVTGPAGGAAGSGNETSGGAAGAACGDGLVTCPGGVECGTDLKTGTPSGDTVNDCGACGVECPLTNAASAACSSGACVPACSPGFADCNSGTANDGCEADLAQPANCGACGHACSKIGAMSLACTSAHCAPTCAPSYADCNQDDGTQADDGCELYLDALDHCATSCSDGVACSPDQVCNGGGCVAPQGMAVLTVPLSKAGDAQRYADVFPSQPNLAGSTLTLRVYAPGATGGMLQLYVTDTKFSFGPFLTTPLTAMSQGWMDVKVPIAPAVGSYDPTKLYQITIEVTASDVGPWANPTVIYIDKIWSSNLLVNDTFDSASTPMVSSSLLKLPNATLTWTDAIP